MSTTYIISSVIWSLVGGLVGFVIGRLSRNVEEIRRKIVDDDAGPSSEPQQWLGLHRPRTQRLLGVVIVVLALLSTLLVAAQTARLNGVIACQAAYNHAYAEALRVRDAATVRSRASAREYAVANQELWRDFLLNAPAEASGRQTGEQRTASLNALTRYLASGDGYIASLDNSSQASQSAPIPSDQC